jgi:transposase-like protein
MKQPSNTRRRLISAARRGQIIQRVIVDGWTIPRVADAFDMPPRLVELWVADYRRHGMASLRRAAPVTIIAECLELWLLRPIAGIRRRISSSLRLLFAPPPPAAPATLRAFKDDGRGGGSS